jgi:hypothetical protein
MLLVLLFVSELQPLLDEEALAKVRDPMAFFDELVGPLCARLRVARRDVERAKLLLLAQRRLLQIRKKGGRLPAGLQQREGFFEALALHALLYRVSRLAEGVPTAQIEEELTAWPLPRTSLLGTRDSDDSAGAPSERGRGSEADSADRPGGRRRRRRSSSEEPASAESAAVHAPRPPLDDDEPVPDEDAVIAAFTAALSNHAGDDD